MGVDILPKGGDSFPEDKELMEKLRCPRSRGENAII